MEIWTLLLLGIGLGCLFIGVCVFSCVLFISYDFSLLIDPCFILKYSSTSCFHEFYFLKYMTFTLSNKNSGIFNFCCLEFTYGDYYEFHFLFKQRLILWTCLWPSLVSSSFQLSNIMLQSSLPWRTSSWVLIMFVVLLTWYFIQVSSRT